MFSIANALLVFSFSHECSICCKKLLFSLLFAVFVLNLVALLAIRMVPDMRANGLALAKILYFLNGTVFSVQHNSGIFSFGMQQPILIAQARFHNAAFIPL